MKSDNPIRLKMSELPKILEVIGPNGETEPFEILPTKGRVGAFLNKVSKPLRKIINKSRY
jgi:hypothetical protein